MAKNLRPAFPNSGGESGFTGMTLRDWFAGQAITSLALTLDTDVKMKSKQAYKLADAMMEAREK